MSVSAFGFNLPGDAKCLAREDEVGEEQPAALDKGDSGDNGSEGQPLSGQPPASEQVIPPEITHENVVNPVSQPVLTQQAIMEIIKRQPHAVMQKWDGNKRSRPTRNC
jgi:hypothetical protein